MAGTRFRRAWLRVVAASAVLIPVTAGVVATPSTSHADALPPIAVLVRGHGNGHGRGLSQYGALGWATKLNASWQDIVNFYYGNAGAISPMDGRDSPLLSDGLMTVRLLTLDGAQTAVVSDNVTAMWGGSPSKYGALLARPIAKNSYDIYGSAASNCPTTTTGVPSGFSLLAHAVAGPIEFGTVNGSTDAALVPTDLPGLCEPASSAYKSGRVRYYHGTIRAVTDTAGAYRTVNKLNIEQYVKGVVPRESPAGWGSLANGAGMNALRAQAVAVRSYGLAEARYTYAKTCDTDACQVYGGAALRTIGAGATATIEDPLSNQAVTDTLGIIMRTAAGAVIRTEFTSTNGGRTAGGAFTAKADDGDIAGDSPNLNWTRVMSASDVQKKYPTIGVLTSVVTTHDGLGGEWNGYAVNVVITGTAGVVTRTAGQFVSDWNLYAPWFDTTPVYGADSAAAPVGSILFIGDSVGEGIATEFANVVTPAYPNMNFQACAGRGMAGAACLFAVTAPQMNLDGVGVANTAPAPAIAVIELGYNDDPNSFDSEVQQMVSALTSKGVQKIIFVNMSTRSTTRNYTRSNTSLTNAAASNPNIVVWDWNTASVGQPQWRWFDNSSLCCWVHLSTSGQAEFALFLRQQLDAMRAAGQLPVADAPVAVIPGLPLAKNNQGSMVLALQKKLNIVLNLKGVKRVGTDGIYGPGTIKAVKAFQASAQLPVTGVTDRATWEAVGFVNRADLAVLKLGTKHPAVKTVQQALAKVLKTKITADGVYSSSLVNYVKTFQKRAGVPQSGKVGAGTWTLLMATLARV
jgi:SpoIID/LytB domain protein